MTDNRLAENVAALIAEADDLVDLQPKPFNMGFNRADNALDAQALLRTASVNLNRIEDESIKRGLTVWHAQVANRVGTVLNSF